MDPNKSAGFNPFSNTSAPVPETPSVNPPVVNSMPSSTVPTTPTDPYPNAQQTYTPPGQYPPFDPSLNSPSQTIPQQPINPFASQTEVNSMPVTPNTPSQPTPSPVAQTVNNPSPQGIFLNDAPPPPAPLGQASPSELVDQPVVSTPKPKNGKKILLLLLIPIILGGIGVGGYFLYNNFLVKKEPAEQILPPSAPNTTNNQPENTNISWKTHTSQILPIEFGVPVNWVVNENQNTDLGNQKSITVSSIDLEYAGSDISKGYQLSVGPVSDLSTRYPTFDEFAAAENSDGTGSIVTQNGTQWIKYPTSAKTLIGDLPLVITLYSAPGEEVLASSMFDQIMQNFKFTSNGQVTNEAETP